MQQSLTVLFILTVKSKILSNEYHFCDVLTVCFGSKIYMFDIVGYDAKLFKSFCRVCDIADVCVG